MLKYKRKIKPTVRVPKEPFHYLDLYITDMIGRDIIDVIDGLNQIEDMAKDIAIKLQEDLDQLEKPAKIDDGKKN